MRKLHKFFGLTAEERRLLATAAILVGLVRVGVWLLPFRTVRGLLGRLRRPAAERRRGDELSSERIAWAVDVVGKRIPGGGNCLVQALATQVLLDRRRRTARLRIGVAKDRQGNLEAHAWIESDGRVIIGGSDVSRFVAFPALERETS